MRDETAPLTRQQRSKRDYLRNREARIAKTLEWRRNNLHRVREYDNAYSQRPEVRAKRRWYLLQRQYGLSESQFTTLMEKQNQQCAICRLPLSDLVPRFVHVDHEHLTGRVRGILCSNCNHGIGHFKDDANLLRAAACYLHQ